jgi:hypothetical protein
MSDEWEKELENLQEDTVVVKDSQYKGESEEIIKPKFEPKAPTEPKENPDDYEKKWMDKNKERLEAIKEDTKAFENIADEKMRLKKLEEKRKLNDAEEFIEGNLAPKKLVEKEVVSGPLNTEKDFIDLAINNVNKITAAGKPSKFAFTYLKQSFDLLAPKLKNDELYQLMQDVTVMFNKLNTSSKSTKKPKKPMINDAKGIAKLDQMGKIETVDQYLEDENDYNDDDFM